MHEYGHMLRVNSLYYADEFANTAYDAKRVRESDQQTQSQ